MYSDDFLIGTAIDFTDTSPLTPEELAIIKTHFNVITPENSMKPGSVHPAEDRWNWAMADTLVNFCQENNIQVVGHCLAWHGQTGRWFFEGENGQPVTREKALERLKQHITTEVEHFKGKLKGWDVVNEAISDQGSGDTENLRPSPWMKAIGPDYINYAFKFAHEADPNVELYYNDYSIEKGNKHQSSLLLLKRLISEGVPINAVGIQGHWGLNYLPYDELDRAIADYKALGAEGQHHRIGYHHSRPGWRTTHAGRCHTGRDIGTGLGAGGRRGAGPAAPPTQEQLEAQAKAYARSSRSSRSTKTQSTASRSGDSTTPAAGGADRRRCSSTARTNPSPPWRRSSRRRSKCRESEQLECPEIVESCALSRSLPYRSDSSRVITHAQVQQPRLTTWIADNGNGTYSNPLFYEEFEDPDVIRVGEDYYLAGTTMHMNPGLMIMHSKDLVNWELASYCIDRLDLGPAYRLEGGNIYGRGIWAPCIRYHDGMFYVFSNVNGVGSRSSVPNPSTVPGNATSCPVGTTCRSCSTTTGKIYIVSGNRQPVSDRRTQRRT